MRIGKINDHPSLPGLSCRLGNPDVSLLCAKPGRYLRMERGVSMILGFILGVVFGMLLVMGGIILALMVLDEEDKEERDKFEWVREVEAEFDRVGHTIH
jgi:hypothetical protein